MDTKLPHTHHQPELAEAAFTAMYEYTFGTPDLRVPYALVDMIAFAVRQEIVLNRAEAQARLRHATSDRVAAALVVMYESVGLHRHDIQATCELDDVLLLSELRREIAYSLRHALRVLTHVGEK